MTKYNVTVKTTITKTYEVTGETEQAAIDKAHNLFNVLNDDMPERYEQETVSVEAVT